MATVLLASMETAEPENVSEKAIWKVWHLATVNFLANQKFCYESFLLIAIFPALLKVDLEIASRLEIQISLIVCLLVMLIFWVVILVAIWRT